MLTLMLAALVAQQPIDVSRSMIEFSRSPAMRDGGQTVSIGALGFDNANRARSFWVNLSEGDQNGGSERWTDSERCPAVSRLFERLAALEMPRFAPLGYDAGGEIVLDGVAYSLKAPIRYGKQDDKIEL